MAATTSTNQDGNAFLSNLKHEDLVRGTTPTNIEQRCLALCQEFIGEVWNQIPDANGVNVTRISGGLANQLYRVQARNEDLRALPNADVAIKIFMPKRMVKSEGEKRDNERLNDAVVTTVLSQVGLGPKVFGISTEAIVQTYYEVS